MDEIRVWDIARTELEISSSFNTGVNSNIPGLIGYWSFNETGQVVTDSSSFTNNASLGSTLTAGSDDPIRTISTVPAIEVCN